MIRVEYGSANYVTDEGATLGRFSNPEHAEMFAKMLSERLPEIPSAIGAAIDEVRTEIHRARTILGHAPMCSAHHGFAVLLEELDELKAHVWMNQKKRDITAMRAEAIRVAAMALCFAAEVCNEETGRK